MPREFNNPTAQKLLEEQRTVERVLARLQGQRWQVYVLAPSRSQFDKWCDEHIYASAHLQPVHGVWWIREAKDLFGVRLEGGIELIELDGWEEAASAELLYRVRLLKAGLVMGVPAKPAK